MILLNLGLRNRDSEKNKFLSRWTGGYNPSILSRTRTKIKLHNIEVDICVYSVNLTCKTGFSR